MNAYEVNTYNAKNSGVNGISKIFPKNGNKITRSFTRSEIDPRTKTCMISITEEIGGAGRAETVWYTFDGSTPRPNNGHRITSKGRIELSVGAVLAAKFSNQPGQQNGAFRLQLDQLTN